MSLSYNILTKVFKWKIVGHFPDIQKSVTIFAPHTSYLDALYGMLFGMADKVNMKYLINKTFFWFPLNLILRALNAIPVQGVKGHNAIFEAVDLLQKEDVHVLISPEGAMAARPKWNKGFLLMARKANVPIVVGYLDFKKKELGVKGIIEDISDDKKVMRQINEYYKDVTAKHPDQFVLDTRDSFDK